VGGSVVLALGVASVKGALVASYFMHLIDEKITIYWTLLITAAMFLILMLLPLGNMLAQTKI
jgi:cytochrome c oxidase subunit IV